MSEEILTLEFVAKFQLSLNDPSQRLGPRQLLIYDESKQFIAQLTASEDVLKLMGDRDKAFYHVSFDEDGQLTIGREAEDPGW